MTVKAGFGPAGTASTARSAPLSVSSATVYTPTPSGAPAGVCASLEASL
jgi:hypothetical protein